MKRLSIFLILFTHAAFGATWYVDSSVGSSGNGQAWATAWKQVANITASVSAGDTVYFSGGPSGSSQTYTVSSWTPKAGTAGNPITYQIGQDASHNGTAVFSGSGNWLVGDIRYAVISGDAGNGKMHFSTTGFSSPIWCNSGNNPGPHDARFAYINFGTVSGDQGCFFNYPAGLEIDHCSMAFTGGNIAWHFANTVGSSGFGTSFKWHHNTLYVPAIVTWNSVNSGPDPIQAGGVGGMDIYNNKIFSSSPKITTNPFSTSQHQDMGQFWIAYDHFRFYNNFIWGSRVTSLYMQDEQSVADQYIFNNIFAYNEDGLDGNDPPLGQRVFTLNNLLVDINKQYGTQGSFLFLLYRTEAGGSWSDCMLGNNALFNSTGGNDTPAYIPQPANVTAASSGYFVNYILGSTNADYHLTAGAANLIQKGTNLTSLVARLPGLAALLYDMDGNPRPATGNWDIGPYQYSSGGAVPPTITSQPVSTSAAVGGTWLLSLTASGTLPISYQWYSQSNPVPALVISGATNGSYGKTLAAVLGDTTNYCCVVTNLYGAATSSPTVFVTVTNGAAYTIQSDVLTLTFPPQATNTTFDLTINVTNTGTATLTNQASVSAPFSIVSGASNSIAVGDHQAVVVRHTPTTRGQDLGTVTLTGGQGITVACNGIAAWVLPKANIACTNMTVFAPFVAGAATIYQSNETATITGSGSAYAFYNNTGVTVDNFTCLCEDTNGANNSIFFKVNGEPQGEPDICDFTNILGAGIFSQVVSARGIGTPDVNAIYPAAFTSSNGLNLIVVRGREPMLLQTFIGATPIIPVISIPPQDTSVTAPGPATFSVSANGSAPLSYQWQWYSTNVTGATLSTLTLPNVTVANSGSPVKVTVSNAQGNVTSSTATLTVNNPAATGTGTVGTMSAVTITITQ